MRLDLAGSAAAGVAQPALSLHIRSMEAELGHPLLFRTPQGVQPTDAGLILNRHARLIIEQLEPARREIRGGAEEPGGEVRLGLLSSIGQILRVPLVLAARQRFPGITLRIGEAMSGYVLDRLRLGSVDLALPYQAADDRAFRSTPLMSETLMLFGSTQAPQDRPHPAGEAIDFPDLAVLRLILPSAGHGLRDLLDATAAARAVRLMTDLDIDAYGAIKDLVGHGLGHSVLPAHAILREVEEGRLRAWAVDPPLSRTVHLVQPADRPLSVATSAAFDLCRETLGDLVRSGAWHAAQLPSAA